MLPLSLCLEDLLLCVLSLFPLAQGISLQVSTSGGNASSPLLYGMMFEDINHSGDGGIHGQLLQNNGFQGTNPNNSAYAPVGSVQVRQDTRTPLSDAITSHCHRQSRLPELWI